MAAVTGLREIPIGLTIFLSIITFGIYYAIWFYRSTHDVQTARGDAAFRYWQLLFWLGFLTFFITWIVLAVVNWMGLNEVRAQAGLPDSGLGIAALVLYFVFSLVGYILWAMYSNNTARGV